MITLNPQESIEIKPLLTLYVKTGNVKANETTNVFFNLEPTNPTKYNDLGEIYSAYNKEDSLTAFYKGKLLAFKDNEKVLDNLNFYLGRIYLHTDKKIAKDYFLKAKDVFTKVYEKDHPVFKAIEDGIKQTEK